MILATTWMNDEDIMINLSKPVTKRQIPSDSTYMSYLKLSNSQKQKAEWQLPGSGERVKWEVFTGHRVLVLQDKKFWSLVVYQ